MWKGEPPSHIHRFPAADSFDFQDWPLVARCTDDVLKAYPRLRLSHGRKVHPRKWKPLARRALEGDETNCCNAGFRSSSSDRLEQGEGCGVLAGLPGASWLWQSAPYLHRRWPDWWGCVQSPYRTLVSVQKIHAFFHADMDLMV